MDTGTSTAATTASITGCLAQRSLVAGKPAAVRERVGCDVENPHHGRDVEFKRTERQHGVIVCRSR
jgi:hypothetical protein